MAIQTEEKIESVDIAVEKENFYPDKLTVSTSPHIKHRDTSRRLMIDVIIALLPALIFGIAYTFKQSTSLGINAIALTVFAVVSCMFFEWGFQKINRRPITILDFSAALTGLLLAMNVPATLPVWMIVVASFFAIVVVKQLFGGIGKNIVNPALAARVMLFMSFSEQMSGKAYDIDLVSSATPLVSLKQGDLSGIKLFDLFIGNVEGSLGETCALLLLIGAVYLLVRKVITWHIPVAYLATVALISFLFPIGGAERVTFMLAELLSGGLILGACFMATDYVTSPVTKRGRIIYGVIAGLITVFIRFLCGNPEGVSFAIMISNLLVWYLDKYTRPKRFGGVKKA